MGNFKNSNQQAYLEPKNLIPLEQKTGNLYESIVIISKRANQIAAKLREELHSQLEQFTSVIDNLEEIHENREQIELSKTYERMPNPTLMAMQEFLEGKVYFRNPHRQDLLANFDLLVKENTNNNPAGT